MSERVEQAFSRLRRGPWNDSPLGVPQEGFGGNGNIESQGWLSDGSVTADVIQANAVIAGKIDADAVTAREIAANTITAAEIAANTITAAQIAASTITSNEIAANTITAADIAANTITASEIAANTITANEIAANTITATEIAADSITTNELAANAVITENILAGNVVSSKIELTVSGKNFGANKGSLSAPGVFFDLDNTIGLTLNGTNTDVILGSGSGAGDPYFQVGPNAGGAMLGQAGDLFPGTDNSFSCGVSGGRWLDVWAVDTTINSSDRRLKKDIEDVPLGLDFIESLRPVSYRWKDTVDTQAREGLRLDGDKLARLVAPHEKRIERIRAQQLAGEIDDATAEQSVAEARAAMQSITDAHFAPWYEARGKRRAGRRQHFGLVADDVKAVLDEFGIDAALYKVGSDGVKSLAYTELMAPMMKAIQELAARVRQLESQP